MSSEEPFEYPWVTEGMSAPVTVSKYLSPSESRVLTLRRHPALLMAPLITVVGGLLVAAVVSILPHNPHLAVIVVWLCEAFLIFRLLYLILNWASQYIAITDQRFILISGYFNRRVTTIAFQELRDFTFERSYAGRMMGYGALIIESGGRSQTVIDYIGYPEQMYLELREAAASISSRMSYNNPDDTAES
jgi:uncharacterized membrane protein YdbT with pleckstrin-like domain